jgi:WS/DGAT/MGAT family acyltransferase
MSTHVRPLSAFDAQFVAGEAGNMMSHYCAVWTAAPDGDGKPLTLDRVRALVESRIDRVPALRWRLKNVPLSLDHPSFVDGPVDLDKHVLGRSLPAGSGERELADAVADIMSVRLDRRRPLWEFHVIDGLAEDRVGVVMKFHHAAADALSAAMLMTLLLDEDPRERGDLPEPVEPQPAPRTRDVTWDALENVPRQPIRALKAGINAIPHLDQVPMMRTIPGARAIAKTARRIQRAAGSDQPEPDHLEAPRTRFNAPLSPGRSIAFGSVPVDQVKELKDAHQATFNDVVVAAVAGGLRRRLAAGDELPDEPLLAFVPANVRKEDTNGRIENAISSYVVAIPTHLEDGHERVVQARTAMNAAKARHADTPVTLLEDANAMVFPIAFGPLAAGMLKVMGTKLVSPPLNLALSNVPGPPNQLHLDGAPLESVAPISLVFDGVALNVTVVSYAGRLEIGIVGDLEAVPDAWELAADIEAEFSDMHAAL